MSDHPVPSARPLSSDPGRPFDQPVEDGLALSSDLGRPFDPPVEDGLAPFADRLRDPGFSPDEVHTMAVADSRKVALCGRSS